ncbi:hypothetical protein [Deinococcus pimensis]|uniref:hypothetical protein n=1 Tax=Deinococcus pimensis TaxID=309888 RepID=UPI000482C3E2|nr:hypothetical protein [Deinococcus pimensis]
MIEIIQLITVLTALVHAVIELLNLLTRRLSPVDPCFPGTENGATPYDVALFPFDTSSPC